MILEPDELMALIGQSYEQGAEHGRADALKGAHVIIRYRSKEGNWEQVRHQVGDDLAPHSADPAYIHRMTIMEVRDCERPGPEIVARDER